VASITPEAGEIALIFCQEVRCTPAENTPAAVPSNPVGTDNRQRFLRMSVVVLQITASILRTVMLLCRRITATNIRLAGRGVIVRGSDLIFRILFGVRKLKLLF
jgi:hypothetical protein